MGIIEKMKMEKLVGLKIIFYVLFSFCFVIGINYYFFSENLLGNQSSLNILFFSFVLVIQIFTMKILKKIRKIAYVFSFIFSSMLVVGKEIYNTNDISSLTQSTSQIGLEIVTVIGFTVAFGCVVSILFEILIQTELISRNKRLWKIFQIPHIYLFLWVLILITWIPCFLAYYPGIFSYDMPTQTIEAVKGISFYTKFHPPLHTIIWSICLSMQPVFRVEAIIIYEIIQMIFLSAILAKLILFLIEKKVNNWIILFSLFFVSINPVAAIFSLIATKDVYFAGFFILTNIYLFKLVDNPEKFLNKKSLFLNLGISIMLCCLFRNNAIYVFVIALFIYLLTFKNRRKKILLLFLIPILGYLFINCFVYGQLGIGEGNNREMMSVPIQQIGNVMVMESEDYSKELIEEVEQYISYDILALYNPRFADPLKNDFQTEVFNKNKIDFMKLWGKLFMHYPKNYVNAFLTLNIPYWYADASTIDLYSQRQYIETSIAPSPCYSFESNSILPKLKSKYEMVACYKDLENIPIISNLFSIATPIWVIIFSSFILYLKNKKKKILILVPSILLWCTYLLGPVSNFRYILPLFLLYPLYVTLIFESKKESKEVCTKEINN